MNRYLITLCAAGMFILPVLWPAVTARGNSSLQMRRATVKITTSYIMPNYSSPWRMGNQGNRIGSGAIIGKNLILTNAHVVSNATYIQVGKEDDPKQYEAEVLFIGHECDLALIKVKDDGFAEDTASLELGGIPELQSTVNTYGYPEGGERISITEGVVSRIEIGTYTHSNKLKLLTIQTDAALNSGNSGGPVIQDNRLAGIAFQVNLDSENIGYMIPTPVIIHFLEDIKDGRYDGFPILGAFSTMLQNKNIREYLKMKESQTGILVTHVIDGSSADDHLKENDIITAIGGNPVANDGSIQTSQGRLGYSYLVSKRQIGETITVTALRNGREKSLKVSLKQFPERIKWYNEFETLPEYRIYGGIIFQPLSREYLKTWKKWWYNANLTMLYYYFYNETDSIHQSRKEFVVINHILPDRSNTYISNVRDVVVSEINGREIKTMSDVINAFKNPQSRFHIIRVDGSDTPLILRVSDVEEANQRIKEKYNLPELVRLNGDRG